MKSLTEVLILSWLSCRQLFPSAAVAVVPLKPILQSASNPTLSPCPHELATSSPLLPTEASAHWPPDLWFTPSQFKLGHNIPAAIFPPQYTQNKKNFLERYLNLLALLLSKSLLEFRKCRSACSPVGRLRGETGGSRDGGTALSCPQGPGRRGQIDVVLW